MKSFIWDEVTEALVKQNGLKCVCQLCDCGKTHRHPDCRLKFPNVSYTLNRNGKSQMITNYQDRYPVHEFVDPPQAIRPLQNAPDPNPPPMDFRTETKVAYKTFNATEKEKPIKLQGELDKLNTGEFEGKTVYKDSYIGHKPKPSSQTRPGTVIKQERIPFQTDTEYKRGFPKKEKVKQEKFCEKPNSTYGLLYPQDRPFPKTSLMNAIHDGSIGEPAKKCEIKASSIQFGSNDVAMTTTNNELFKKYDVTKPASSKRPKHRAIPSKPFNDMTQTRVTYSYDENEARKARAKTCEEHPSEIKISMDLPDDYNTIAGMTYQHWKPEKNTAQKPTGKRYTPPKQKFDGKSQSQTDYIDYGVKARTGLVKPNDKRKSSAKMVKDSSYKLAYPDHGKFNRKLYGDQNANNLFLPPKSEKFEGKSVMRDDFNTKNIEVQKMYKPDVKSHTQNSGDFDDATEYKEAYKTTLIKPCTFTKVLVDAELRRNDRLNIGSA